MKGNKAKWDRTGETHLRRRHLPHQNKRHRSQPERKADHERNDPCARDRELIVVDGPAEDGARDGQERERGDEEGAAADALWVANER